MLSQDITGSLLAVTMQYTN